MKMKCQPKTITAGNRERVHPMVGPSPTQSGGRREKRLVARFCLMVMSSRGIVVHGQLGILVVGRAGAAIGGSCRARAKIDTPSLVDGNEGQEISAVSLRCCVVG